MDEVIVTRSEVSDERAREFRRAAGQRGIDGVVDWNGSPHVVTSVEGAGAAERFTLEPIPRPFG